MKYLVTGGAGFIGTNLVKYLLNEGHQVAVVDNYAGGRKEDRILSGVDYIEADVCDLDKMKKIFSAGYDGIFHLAALPRVTYSVEQPWETHQANVDGTLKVLIAARDNNIKRVVFASSSSVYGNPESFPTSEELPVQPISPYALHKFVGEHYLRLFSELYGLETVSLRYFNVYGPYFDPEGPYALVIGKFIMQAKNGQPMTICGDGEYYRDYTHVADICRANYLAMIGDKVGRGEVINIGNGAPMSVNQLAKLIGGEVVYISERIGDVRRTEASIKKAQELLGWTPTINLADGVEELKKNWGMI